LRPRRLAPCPCCVRLAAQGPGLRGRRASRLDRSPRSSGPRHREPRALGPRT
jgi:hypothetical protein